MTAKDQVNLKKHIEMIEKDVSNKVHSTLKTHKKDGLKHLINSDLIIDKGNDAKDKQSQHSED